MPLIYLLDSLIQRGQKAVAPLAKTLQQIIILI